MRLLVLIVGPQATYVPNGEDVGALARARSQLTLKFGELSPLFCS